MERTRILLIENESPEQIERDVINSVEQATDRLITLGFDKSAIHVLYNYANLERDAKIAEVLEAPNLLVCSYSMFTAAHYNSLAQMTNMLGTAAQARDLVFIDLSGQLPQALNRVSHVARTVDGVIRVFEGVARNFIYTYDYDTNTALRIKPSFDKDLFEVTTNRLIVAGTNF